VFKEKEIKQSELIGVVVVVVNRYRYDYDYVFISLRIAHSALINTNVSVNPADVQRNFSLLFSQTLNGHGDG
jgi:hypothetical protein